MNKRRIICAILLFSMLAATACGGETPVNDETTTSSGTTDEITTEASEYSKPSVRYDGQTITIASYSYSGGNVINSYNILLDEENGDFINDAIVERNRKVEEELGVELELYALTGDDRGNTNRLQQSILAGDDEFDFALTMNAGLATMLTTDGMLVDLNSVKTLDLTHSWWNQNANDEYTLYGKQLTAVGDICFFNIAAPIVNYFSKELVERYKLDDPYKLVYDGKWTVDVMRKMATEVASDLNGNQTVDDADQFGLAGETDTLGYFLMGAGVRLSEHDKNGDIRATLNSERTITLIEKLVPFLCDDSLVRFLNRTEKTYTSVFTEYFEPKLGMNEILFYSNQLLVALNLRANEADFGVLPLAKYDESQEDYISFANTWWSDHLVIPATNTNLDRTGHVIESMGYYAQQLIVPAFIDTTVLGKSVRDEDSANMIKLVRETQTFDIAYIFNWGGIRSVFNSLMSSKSTDFASKYAGIENAVTDALAKTEEQLKD